MAQTINTNVASLNAQRNLNTSQGSLATSLQRLSSGLRINSAKDDAAGLAISDRMTSQIRGLNQATRNANDGISLAQTAEGAMTEIGNNLQRIRELALQSANSTNSASDRDALNAEVQQTLAEIQRVATSTQFNGLNLLDGTFSNAQFQIGANAAQTINVSVAGATTNALGAYQADSAAVSTAALTGSGFSINGVSIGASVSTTAAGFSNSSAAAKAAAINAKTAETGVTATASTELTGSAPIAGTDLANGALKINGVAVGYIASSASAVTQGQNAATEINKLTSQTGVSATVNMTTGALTLASSEGRDIKLETSAGTAQGATDIFNAIGLDVSTGANPTGNNSQVITIANAFDADNSSTNGLTVSDYVTIDNIDYEFVTDANSVTAGKVAVVVADTDSATVQADALRSAINNQYALGNTTVTASGPTGAITLTQTKLGNETVGYVQDTGQTNAAAITDVAETTGTDAVFAAGGVTTTGTLKLSSAENFSFSGSEVGAVGLSSTSPTLSKLADVAIDTLEGANSAISVLDGALAQVNSQRAALGAYQNRFQSTIANLQTTSENLSAARGRIIDADFAQETANLTRGQILQQAGTAMLAQANSLPQGVLSLLRG